MAVALVIQHQPSVRFGVIFEIEGSGTGAGINRRTAHGREIEAGGIVIVDCDTPAAAVARSPSLHTAVCTNGSRALKVVYIQPD